MDAHAISLELASDHQLADELNATDPVCKFDDTRWPGKYELHIIKLKQDRQVDVAMGFCLIALQGTPEVAKFFICPEFRRRGLSVAAARRVFEYIENTHGYTYSLQIRDKVSCQELIWRFWCKALEGREATQSGLNFLLGDWTKN